jgi:vancomycin resistance protein YoaR
LKKQRFGPAFLVIAIMLVLIAVYAYAAYLQIKPETDRICDGVYIDTLDVSGMTREEAEQAVSNLVSGLGQRTLEVDVNGETVESSLSALGFTCSANDYIDQALELGKTGNVFKDYAALKEIQKENISYTLDYTYSEKKLKKFVSNTCGQKCTKAKNSKIKMKKGKLVYTEAKEGITVDVSQTIQEIKSALETQEKEEIVKVAAVVTREEPTITKEEASRCKDKIGSYSTEYNPGNISRSKNVANAASLINGSIIYPGETFSVHDTISPLTEKNGYYEAPSYSNGQVVDSIGGGVCQVSTTLYNAVLRAELEVVERSPHSMLVTYVSPSMDAAIAGDYKDFKFRNNTDVPLYIEGGASAGTVYFKIYGEETRSSDRTISFESETIETIAPGEDKVTYDDTKPASYSVVTQEAHQGCRAVLWKIVTENGKTEKTQVNSSTYAAEPRYVTKGSAGTSAETESPQTTENPSGTSKPSATEKAGSSKSTTAPKVTKAPKKTAAPKVTKAPQATAAPKATKAPQKTAEPEVTEAPAEE